MTDLSAEVVGWLASIGVGPSGRVHDLPSSTARLVAIDAPIDAAHFRVNLATLHDAETADRVLAADPAWDLEAALGYLDWWDPARIDTWVGPWPHIPPDLVRDRLERFVGRAVAALG